MIATLSGNSRVLLSLDERGSWTQLYYPHPGLHQHLASSRIGLFDVDASSFAWLDQPGGAPVELSYVEHSNAARSTTRVQDLEVVWEDMVHPNLDLVIRRIVLRNPSGRARDLRLFLYHSLNISGAPYQGTAYWDPDSRTLNHYKRGYYFVFRGQPDFDGFTCGEHTLKGLVGSHVDAEDGVLRGNPISHGAADSVVQWNLSVPPGGERAVQLQLIIDRSRQAAHHLVAGLGKRDPELVTTETVGYWNHWTANRPAGVTSGLSSKAQAVYERSLFVMRDCQSAEGAIIASPDASTLKSGGDTYNYCWWRDGAFVARAMGDVGLRRNEISFLRFAARCQEEEGHFVHRHYPDGSVGSTWHPPPFLQADQTGEVLDAVAHYYDRTGALDDLLPLWPLVRKGADFLMGFVDSEGLPRPSYDLWEERKAVNAFTVGAVLRGLRGARRVAAALAKPSEFWSRAADRMEKAAVERFWNPSQGALLKSLHPSDGTLDSASLASGLLAPSDPRFAIMVATLEKRLWNGNHGGLARYEGDQYYGRENPWVISTLWLARAHLALGNQGKCRELVEWTASKAGDTFLLPEQIDAQTGEPTSVTPLVWSHSTFAEVVNELHVAARGVQARSPARTLLASP